MPVHGTEVCPRHQASLTAWPLSLQLLRPWEGGGGLSVFNRPARLLSRALVSGNVIPRVYLGSSF